ncbi:LOW QUALITY PROTEIN: protein Bop [Leptonychotes weddellii]|uniref:LOW QUALITY PROTEIN: protein Bop n=1 Tax=Leptonychotes weddellii TaxID=9713 RepID=A0A7F8Q574_LEPWE|nr:LOW QUALITY PROTEIN: protein Bop [Leptonychotes weddellii]
MGRCAHAGGVAARRVQPLSAVRVALGLSPWEGDRSAVSSCRSVDPLHRRFAQPQIALDGGLRLTVPSALLSAPEATAVSSSDPQHLPGTPGIPLGRHHWQGPCNPIRAAANYTNAHPWQQMDQVSPGVTYAPPVDPWIERPCCGDPVCARTTLEQKSMAMSAPGGSANPPAQKPDPVPPGGPEPQKTEEEVSKTEVDQETSLGTPQWVADTSEAPGDLTVSPLPTPQPWILDTAQADADAAVLLVMKWPT